MPSNPLENADERIEQFERVRDQNLENILAASDFEDEQEFWDAVKGGPDVTVEIDAADLVVLLGELETAAYQPGNAIEHVHTLDLLVRLTRQHEDELQEYVDMRNDQMDDDGFDGPRGFQ